MGAAIRGGLMTEFEFDAKVLEAVPLFSGLPRGDLEDIIRLGRKVSFDAGVDIVQSGDPGDGMYFLLKGRTQLDVGGRYHRLGPGDFFGEMALLGVRKRLATVKAIEPVEALKIPAARFQELLLDHPSLALAMMKTLVERLREVEERIDAWMGGTSLR
jgi:voltage-gated potassium channel